MQAILISKNEINKIKLPQTPTGSYWITSKGMNNKENKLVNIEGNGINWQLNSSRYSKLVDVKNISIEQERIRIINSNNDETSKKVDLEEYGIYVLLIGIKEEVSILY